MKTTRESLLEASVALDALRNEVRWRPGKDEKHLAKRKAMGHLPQHFSLGDYNALINELIRDDRGIVYLYGFIAERYYAVKGSIRGIDWIAIFGKDGIMETAFPPEDIERYTENRGFRLLGRIEEVMRWKRKREKGC